MTFDAKKAVSQVSDDFFNRGKNKEVIDKAINVEKRDGEYNKDQPSVDDFTAVQLENTQLINSFMDKLRPKLLERSQQIQTVDYQRTTDKDGQKIVTILINNNDTGVFLFEDRLLKVIRQNQTDQLISVLPDKIFQALQGTNK